jgi:energy-coupling factor transporter transmembrane protein EcfT
MRSINPACKLVGMVVLTMSLAVAQDWLANLVVFTLCMGLMWQTRVPARLVLIRLAPLVAVSAGMFMTGYRFASNPSTPDWIGGMIHLDPRVANGMLLSSRVLAYAGLGFLFACSTDKIDLVRSLQRQLQVPAMYAYSLIAAWNILPDLEHEYRRTRRAFQARGLYPQPFSPALLKPMLIKSVMWSQALAMAMESKGFDGHASRTERDIPAVKPHDVLFLVAMAGAAVFLLWL